MKNIRHTNQIHIYALDAATGVLTVFNNAKGRADDMNIALILAGGIGNEQAALDI